MSDTYYLQRRLDAFYEAIPDEAWTDELNSLKSQIEMEIYELADDWCERDHVDEGNYEYVNGESAQQTVLEMLFRLRMGYDMPSLEAILEQLTKEFE